MFISQYEPDAINILSHSTFSISPRDKKYSEETRDEETFPRAQSNPEAEARLRIYCPSVLTRRKRFHFHGRRNIGEKLNMTHKIEKAFLNVVLKTLHRATNGQIQRCHCSVARREG